MRLDPHHLAGLHPAYLPPRWGLAFDEMRRALGAYLTLGRGPANVALIVEASDYHKALLDYLDDLAQDPAAPFPRIRLKPTRKFAGAG